MEEKIAKIATSIVSGSFMVLAILLLLLYGLAAIFTGEVSDFLNPFVLKMLSISILYIGSIYFLATLPGKSAKRRLASWGYSIIFHSIFLLYLWLISGKENIVFLVGLIECTILFLSLAGLLAFYYENEKTMKV